MATEQVKTVAQEQETIRIHILPFGGLDKSARLSSLALPDDHLICLKPVAKYDESTPGLAVPDFSNSESLQKVISSFEQETGLAYVMRQINAGRVHPFQLNDNGKKGVDLSIVPDNINDARAAAQSTHDAASKLAHSLGLKDVDPATFQEAVKMALEKIAQSANPVVKETTQNE